MPQTYLTSLHARWKLWVLWSFHLNFVFLHRRFLWLVWVWLGGWVQIGRQFDVLREKIGL